VSARSANDDGAKHYVVFNCQACGAKIFAEAKQVGQAGVCPACRQMTGVTPSDPKQRVSGPTAPPKPAAGPASTRDPNRLPSGRTRAGDRRRVRRVPLNDARVGVEGKAKDGRPATSDGTLSELLDISESGIGYVAAGVPDRKKLTGYAPPPIKVGEQITVSLHVPALFRPRIVKAIVRRIDPHVNRKELFRIGCEFVGLAEDERADIRKLVDKRPESRG
jgi:hypothetical protein